MKNYTKCGRIFKTNEILKIIELTKRYYNTHLCRISREICKKLNWHSENGKPKEWICRELMIQLEKDNLLKLPPPQRRSFNRFKKKKIDFNFKQPDTILQGKLGEFQKPVFKRVVGSYDNSFWEYLVDRYHYLGYKGVLGRFLKYIVYIDNIEVACIGWSGASWRVTVRDKWINWDDETRVRKLKHIANNFRFVIFPWAQIKFLASHILSKNIPLLLKDWKDEYNVDIYLLETFIEVGRFSGISYRASNWQRAGQTKGYGKTKTSYKKHNIIKDVYLYPARKNSVKLLRELK